MHSVPRTFRQVTEEFAPAFTRPTLTRFTFLLFAAILTIGYGYQTDSSESMVLIAMIQLMTHRLTRNGQPAVPS
jgi:hypothetical protein